jgi:hypothetical protein
MPKWTEELGLTALKAMVLGLLGLVGGIFSVLWNEISSPFLEKVAPQIPHGTLLAIILLLGLLFGIESTWLIYLYTKEPKKIKVSDYEISQERCYYTHKKTKIKYCPVCITDEKLIPLYGSPSNLICKRCNRYF